MASSKSGLFIENKQEFEAKEKSAEEAINSILPHLDQIHDLIAELSPTAATLASRKLGAEEKEALGDLLEPTKKEAKPYMEILRIIELLREIDTIRAISPNLLFMAFSKIVLDRFVEFRDYYLALTNFTSLKELYKKDKRFKRIDIVINTLNKVHPIEFKQEIQKKGQVFGKTGT